MNTRSQLRRSPKSAAGFSLIELCFVVAIILVLAAIAVPRYLRARDAAKEASAVASVRNINTAEQLYSVTYGMGYTTLSNLGGDGNCKPSPTSACLIDENLAAGHRGNYNFEVTLTAPMPGFGSDFGSSYNVKASPDATLTKEAPMYCSNPLGPVGHCGGDLSQAAASIVKQN